MEKKHIVIEEKANCCGCSACFSVCPTNAIIMAEDEYGFQYPFVDEKACVGCGKCQKVCPILSSHKKQLSRFKWNGDGCPVIESFIVD